MKLYLSLLRESYLFAIQSLWSNKLRTSLSLLGVTIGIYAIIAVFTMIDTLESKITDSVKNLGDDVVYVNKWPWEFGGNYPWWKYYKRPVPKYKELEQLNNRLKYADATCFKVNANHTVKYLNLSMDAVSIVGASHQYNQIKNFKIKYGRYFTETESSDGSPVIIIGNNVAQNIFNNEQVEGRQLKILGKKFTIIGIIEKEGEDLFGSSADNSGIIPIKAASNIININDEDANPEIIVKAKAGIVNKKLKEDLTIAMRSIRRITPGDENDFAINESSLISKGFDSLFAVINITGIIIGGFSILVGCFGVANIMFVSVKERTSQIGIQKSLGAKNYFILFQFLVESVILCIIGGIIGLLLVQLSVFGINSVADFDVTLTLKNMILGVFISAAIGLIAGILPAINAANLSPIEAIRST